MPFNAIGAFVQQNENVLLVLLFVSLITFIATLIAVPWMIVRIPEDYFSRRDRTSMLWGYHPVLRILLLVGKNLLGGLLIVLGLSMLLLPGQGLLTMFMGIILLDFPGKFHFQCWLIRRRPVLRSVNWLRTRRGRKPLRFDSDNAQRGSAGKGTA